MHGFAIIPQNSRLVGQGVSHPRSTCTVIDGFDGESVSIEYHIADQ